jgi:nucleotide-binding universal stress UspA family protein
VKEFSSGYIRLAKIHIPFFSWEQAAEFTKEREEELRQIDVEIQEIQHILELFGAVTIAKFHRQEDITDTIIGTLRLYRTRERLIKLSDSIAEGMK